jgi:DNA helicase-2/ATP-dependent DNA helicase PcrA
MSVRVAVDLRRAYLIAAEALRDNPGQWNAYNSSGNCVVLAGPGSGKTKTLTIKLARMLAEDVCPPRGIACLTYNTECVRDLKRKLIKLGIEERQDFFIGTVHSFCLQNVVLPYGLLTNLDLPNPLTIALPSDQKKFFERAFAKVKGSSEDPRPWKTKCDYYRRTNLDRNSREWHAEEATAKIIETYEKELRLNGMIDFDDMVLLGMRLIECMPWVRKALSARFPILVVDEYQDLGVPLHRIVKSLYLSGNIRLFAVGDPDQSIYGFTGARPELLGELARLEGVETIPLHFNYRCGNAIIQASEIALGEARNYKGKDGHIGSIEFHCCPKGIDEQAATICNKIIPDALKIRKSCTFGDIAVLYLDKNDGDIIAEHAKSAGIKFIRIDRGAPYRKTPLIHWLEDCALWCSGGWKEGVPSLSTLIRSWIWFNKSLISEQEQHLLKTSLVSFLATHRSPDLSLIEWLSEFDRICIYLTLQRELILRDEAEAFSKLLNACKKGSILADLTVASFARQGGSKDNLNLITLHSAKGLEFDVVVMMGMDQGRIPSWTARSTEDKKESRRLFYVGLTRAKHEVHLTYSCFTVSPNGYRFKKGPSEFLLEIQKSLNDSA